MPFPAGGLRQALAEYDRRGGLGAAGPITNAIDSAAMGATARGTAIFAIRADIDGRIAAVRLTAANQDIDAWRRFGASLGDARVGPLRLPEGASGVWVVVRVDAKITHPAGDRSSYPGTLFAFDSTNLDTQPLRVVHAEALSELWY